VKKTKVGSLINNSDLKLPNGRYSKKHKKVFKNISPEGQSFKKYDFSDKNYGFPAPTIYMQLPDSIAIHRWKELFNPKKMTYYLSIYFPIW